MNLNNDLLFHVNIVYMYFVNLLYEELDTVKCIVLELECKILVRFHCVLDVSNKSSKSFQLYLCSTLSQTYQRITAEVDPLTVASFPDLDLISRRLKDDFGVHVTYQGDDADDVTSVHSSDGTLLLSGSMLQIQCAQTYLDHVFEQQQVCVLENKVVKG